MKIPPPRGYPGTPYPGSLPGLPLGTLVRVTEHVARAFFLFFSAPRRPNQGGEVRVERLLSEPLSVARGMRWFSAFPVSIQAHAPVGAWRAEPVALLAHSDQPSTAPGRRLFVGGIPFGMTEDELARIFDGVALPHEVRPVQEVTVMLWPSGQPRGFGFIQLATLAQAQRAQAVLSGRSVKHCGRSRKLVVRPATATDSGRRVAPFRSRMLWIGNLSFGTRASLLRQRFASAAGIKESQVYAAVATDRVGRSRGYGSVLFEQAEAAQRALEQMRGAEVGGRLVQVELERSAGGDEMPCLMDREGEHPDGDLHGDADGDAERLGQSVEAGGFPSAADGADAEVVAFAEQAARLAAAEARAIGLDLPPQPCSDPAQENRQRRNSLTAKQLMHRREREAFVRGLPFSSAQTELRAELRKLLKGKLPAEAVRHVWIASDQFGRPRGYARISTRCAPEARAAASCLDGAKILGREISAHWNADSARFSPSQSSSYQASSSQRPVELEEEIEVQLEMELEEEIEEEIEEERRLQGLTNVSHNHVH